MRILVTRTETYSYTVEDKTLEEVEELIENSDDDLHARLDKGYDSCNTTAVEIDDSGTIHTMNLRS